ncbi:T9SS type B sorting domain-containing protein, partial [Lutibacter oceani]
DAGTSNTTITNFTTAATGDQSDPTTVGDDLSESITVSNNSDIILTKVVDNATPNTGDVVTYTITVTNNGPAVVTGLVVTDVLPVGLAEGLVTPSAGSWTSPLWTIGTLGVGATETMTIEASVTALGEYSQPDIVNTATNAQDQDDSSLPSEASSTINVTSTDLVTIKTVSDATPYEGQTIVYSIAVTNYGPSDATGVSLVDLLPDGVTYVSDNQGGLYNSGDGNWMIGDLSSGSTITLDVTATVDALTSGDTITNVTTSASGDQTDPNTTTEGFPEDDLDAVITVENYSDIILTKVVDNATPNTGDVVTYTITVTNNGPAVVTGLVVTDVLPVGLAEGLVTPSAGSWTSPLWTIGTLGVGATETMTIEASVTALGEYSQPDIVNTATNAQDQDDSSLPSEASSTINVTSTDLVTIKTVSDATPYEGQTIVYSIAVTNYGPSDATGVSLVDLLPDGVTYVSDNQGGLYNSGDGNWMIGDLSSGSTITLDVTATVDALTSGDTITNVTTSASGDQTDPNTTTEGFPEDDLDAVITVENYSDIILTKVVDNATPNTGDVVTYTITVTNNGPSVVTGLIVRDVLPDGLTEGLVTPSAGLWTSPLWTIGTLGVGVTETMTIEALVTAEGTINQTPIRNIADHVQDQIDLTSPSISYADIVVTASDLETIKVVDIAEPFENDTIIYTITVTNNGPSDATNVSLTDLLPTGVTYITDDIGDDFNSGSGIWTIGTILEGTSATINITASVDVGTAGETITNSTTAATSDQTDPTTDGDVLDATITVENYSDIVLTKAVDNATPNVGDTVTYTVTVKNNGPAKVTGLVVTDVLPTGLTYGTVSPSDGIWTAPNWNVGTLESGEEETIVIEAIVGMDQGGQTLINTVSNSQDQIDSDLTEDDASETIVVTSSDLVTVKTVSNKTPNEGDTITYTIEVTNNGPNTATGVSLIDNLPVGVTFVSHSTGEGNFNYGSGLWDIGELPNGITAILTIVATVDDGTLGQTITNTTSAVTADQSDPDTTNNIGSVSIIPTAYIDLSLTKSVVDDVVDPEVGDIITFEIRVDNEGPTEATGVQVTDVIPSGYDFVNYSSSIGTYNPITGLWNIGFIEIGNTAVLLVDVIVMDSGDYENCAEITAANEIDIDSTPDNGNTSEDDYDCASAPPIQEVDLKIEKTVIADNLTPLVNTEVSFEIRLINDGDIEATEVVVTDLLPTGYTYLNYSSTRGTYDDDSGIWNVGTIVDGETEVLVIDAIVNATGEYLNCATITEMHQTDPDLSNNTSCIATNPVDVVDLELTKEVALSLGNQGPVSTTGVLQPYAETNVDFTITLTNNGPSDATGVQVVDLLPNGYNFVSVSVSTGSYDDGSGIWNVGTIVNGAIETLIITAYVNPLGNWLNVAEVLAVNELDLDSTPNNGDIFEDDMDQISTNPIVLLTIAEGFSPNGDGINDVFEIEFLEVLFPNFGMEIVDRYGNLVYKYKHNGNPYQTPEWWNGFSSGSMNFNNEALPSGTYFYTIYFNNNERKPQTGWIYLRK